MYKRKLKFVFLTFILGFLPIAILGQVSISSGSLTSSESADLILGSTDKGFLPNQVELVSLDSPQPLSDLASDIQDGTLVYNMTETNGFPKGLYIWRENKWNILLMVPGKRQDYINLVYKQTANSVDAANVVTLPYITSSSVSPVLLGFLSSEFTIPDTQDGDIIISSLIYAQMVDNASAYSKLGNSFFTITVTDVTENAPENGTSTSFYSACTPITMRPVSGVSGSNGVNNNPVSALSFSTLPVLKGHTYQVRVYGQEGWNGAATVTAGTFNWSTYYANSVLKIDFQSDPY